MAENGWKWTKTPKNGSKRFKCLKIDKYYWNDEAPHPHEIVGLKAKKKKKKKKKK